MHLEQDVETATVRFDEIRGKTLDIGRMFRKPRKPGKCNEFVKITRKPPRKLMCPRQANQRDLDIRVRVAESAKCGYRTEQIAQHQRTKDRNTSRFRSQHIM
jgi:hypothetical protein